MSKLTNQVAVVTGASKGIGAGIAIALAAEGASVVVNYASSKAGADKVVDTITAAGGKAIAVQGDVSKPADIARLFAETKKAYGKINILVNNAGIYNMLPLEQITEEHIDSIFAVNVRGLLLTTKEALPLFGPEGGSVINIGSAVSSLNPPNSSVYTATKAAVDSITKVLAKELGARKIRVNAINPGLIETEGVTTAGFHEGDFRTWVETSSPLGRIGQVSDISPTAVYLASTDSAYVTGESLLVSGGFR
ncbi:SDR family NAD(P)-dependent oxidoreductase [Granulicella sibirica]|uniref:3-oxoacyl-[acyl-carrier protein] reductase n=1 Tax=Granulicella sibirica TaxID=2479048 RepID=A0A4Q0T9J3_9BACT|nr:glucose 1-dehydrogenase [Granulicella sibirica]RXH58719.1 3-oxoacyl-[acyl-carrier protein] reductase [Granulicella sibirica]